MKDERCKVCTSNHLAEITSGSKGWFGKRERVVENAFRLPEEVVEARLVSWGIWIGEDEERRLRRRGVGVERVSGEASGMYDERGFLVEDEEEDEEVSLEGLEEEECVMTFE